MRIYILTASAVALAACGGSTAPVSSTFVDASSDVAIDHVVAQVPDGGASTGSGSSPHPHVGPASNTGHQGLGSLALDAGTGSASDASADAAKASGPFECGGVTCTPPNQYCSITKTGGGGLFDAGGNTSSECTSVPFSCTSGANCDCLSPFEGGTPGCTCEDNGGAVTLTCNY